MLLLRGVQPSEIENMSLDRIDFWLEICEVIADAQKKASANLGS
ncbi:MAG: hypothetical protein Q8M35_09710 [Pseudohongiella sp.]|nr:hypothetical protein [Methylotenera sp.]MDO9151109.1 hypothetical protein [Methylotenera sp.]MDP2380737.1 hypothetical protein [Pseudohongiella sp.]